MKINKNFALISFLFSFLSIFWAPIKTLNPNTHLIGFPLNFIRYKGSTMLTSRFQLFLPRYFIQTQWRLDLLIINVLILYVMISVFNKIIKTYQAKN